MILADTVLYDWTTGKSTIQGTYETLESAKFPFTHPSIVVYVVLTEGYGDTEVQLRLVELHPIVVIGFGKGPSSPGGTSLGYVSPERLRKYANSRPLRRQPFRKLTRKPPRTEE